MTLPQATGKNPWALYMRWKQQISIKQNLVLLNKNLEIPTFTLYFIRSGNKKRMMRCGLKWPKAGATSNTGATWRITVQTEWPLMTHNTQVCSLTKSSPVCFFEKILLIAWQVNQLPFIKEDIVLSYSPEQLPHLGLKNVEGLFEITLRHSRFLNISWCIAAINTEIQSRPIKVRDFHQNESWQI